MEKPMMKKKDKLRGIILGIAIIAIVVIVANCGRIYYQNRYVSEDYYARVPLDYNEMMQPEMKYTDDGKEMAKAMTYDLIAYSAEGMGKEVEFSIFERGSGWATEGDYIEPGTYLHIKASKTLVNGWEIIQKAAVPEKALACIETLEALE